MAIEKLLQIDGDLSSLPNAVQNIEPHKYSVHEFHTCKTKPKSEKLKTKKTKKTNRIMSEYHKKIEVCSAMYVAEKATKT